MAMICGSLAWVALTERQLTTASRVGIHYSQGLAAVIQGFFWLGASLGFIGTLAVFSRFKRLIWFALGLLWVGAVAAYSIFIY
jgi:hypothetical protein